MVRYCLYNNKLTRGQVIMNPENRKKLGCGSKWCIRWKECMNQKEV